MNNQKRYGLSFLLMAISLCFSPVVNASCLTLDPKNFDRFILETKHAQFEKFKEKKDVAVTSKPEFEKMKAYIIKYYAGKHILKSFTSDGEEWDCMLMKDQTGWTNATAPTNLPGPISKQSIKVSFPPTPCDCAGRTVPVRRLTLSYLTRSATLQRFFSKG